MDVAVKDKYDMSTPLIPKTPPTAVCLDESDIGSEIADRGTSQLLSPAPNQDPTCSLIGCPLIHCLEVILRCLTGEALVYCS